MGKSLGNFITLDQFFTGDHPKLTQAYSPMTIRFFILGAHYRGTVDFSNEALQAANKGLVRLLDANDQLDKLATSSKSSYDIASIATQCAEAMNDDLNTPIVIATLFDAAKLINRLRNGEEQISQEDLDELKRIYRLYLFDILGMKDERVSGSTGTEAYKGAVNLLLDIRQTAKSQKDWATSDKIRNALTELGFTIKDTKEGAEWQLNE